MSERSARPAGRPALSVHLRTSFALAAATALTTAAAMTALSGTAYAEGCSPNTEYTRQAQAQTRSSLAPLPDCRAYEQVSPVNKNGVDASGDTTIAQASPTGAGITYFAVEPLPGTVGSANLPSYLGTRAAGGGEWLTQGLEALAPAGATEVVNAVTEDLAKTVIKVASTQAAPPCTPTVEVCGGPEEFNYYVRDNTTGAFQLLAELGTHDLLFADANHGGSRILFETEAKLTEDAQAGVFNLYEWNKAKPPAERVSLAGVLPGGAAPAKGSAAGPGGPLAPPAQYYHQNTVSEDGSRIFFSDLETGIVYMREPEAARTIQVSAGNEPAFWRAATKDGGYVFYSEGEELYRFNLARFGASGEPELVALAEAREQLTTGAEGILGVAGISETDGAYVYFVAPGVLAENENGNGEKAIKGEGNLYAHHDGEPTPTFIARLLKPSAGAPQDEADWRAASNTATESGGPSGGERAARVSSAGRYLLFTSVAPLTGYHNNGESEFYLYDAAEPPSSLNPVCVTCNPAGTPATASARLANSNSLLTGTPNKRNPFMTHNLSSDGHRVFFETEESLIPGDANLQNDIYEWEAEGSGTCTSKAQDGGCLYLISTGQTTGRSYFADVSADGSDVFFFTRQSLVSQDEDLNVDLYDVRVEGGIASQNPAPASPPCAQEATCRGVSSNMPSTFGAPASTTFSGSGNLASPPGVNAPVKTEPQVRAEKLAKALKACRSKPKSKRKRCDVVARKRYGTPTRKAKKSTIRGVVTNDRAYRIA